MAGYKNSNLFVVICQTRLKYSDCEGNNLNTFDTTMVFK